MEKLLFLTIFISTHLAVASDVDRFDKRTQGFDSHVEKLEKIQLEHQESAKKFRGTREKYAEAYRQIRDSYKRPERRRTDHLLPEHLRKLDEKEQERLQKQKKFAAQHREEINIIDRKARVIKRREYHLDSSK